MRSSLASDDATGAGFGGAGVGVGATTSGRGASAGDWYAGTTGAVAPGEARSPAVRGPAGLRSSSRWLPRSLRSALSVFSTRASLDLSRLVALVAAPALLAVG